ncbi:uncharacterized protein LOC144773718 [Lissotriton helveticus]
MIRANTHIRGIPIQDSVVKLAAYADDVLIITEKPDTSIAALMSTIEEYAQVSGYKLNKDNCSISLGDTGRKGPLLAAGARARERPKLQGLSRLRKRRGAVRGVDGIRRQVSSAKCYQCIREKTVKEGFRFEMTQKKSRNSQDSTCFLCCEPLAFRRGHF